MVDRINLKLFIMAMGLLLAIMGVYMNGLTEVQGKEASVFLVVMGIALSFGGAIVPMPAEREVRLEAPPIIRGVERAERAERMERAEKAARGGEKADEMKRLKDVEFLCPKCGAPVTGDMIFCTNCGRRIVSEKKA
jgi:DNA-directed RNA polymerase subunit RPC12/RpoP